MEIIRLTARKSGGTYLRVFIGDELYDGSFADMGELHRHFRAFPRHLQGEAIPDVIYDTKVLGTYGATKEHNVLAVFGSNLTPQYYLVGGPLSFLRSRKFNDLPQAVDHAEREAAHYDLNS